MRTQLLHLHGPLRGTTVTYEPAHLLVGTDPDAHVRYPPGTPGIQPRHAEIAFRQEDCLFYLRTLQGPVFVNSREVREIVLNHDDLLEFGMGGPRARFRIYMELGAVCKPVRQMLGDAVEVGHSGGVFAFSQSFIRDLFTHATLQLKIGFPAAVLLLVLGISYAAGWLGGRKQKELYLGVLDEIRRDLEASRQESARSLAELQEMRQQIQRQSPVLEELVAANRSLEKVLKEYTRGVCLVHGIYAYHRPDPADPGRYQPLLDTRGSVLTSEYVGSGFLATTSGMVVTNRHIAQPWWRDTALSRLRQMGFAPYFLHLTVTFPGRDVVTVDPGGIRVPALVDVDVAVLQVDAAQVEGIPVLPLHQGPMDSLVGQKVIVLGYPTGVNALLAKLEPDTLDKVMRLVPDRNLTGIIAQLAGLDGIQPHVTQGSLGQILERQLVYDALTTSGGSGGPVFHARGQVIGVNAAILRDFTGSNFGVPVHYVLPLLQP